MAAKFQQLKDELKSLEGGEILSRPVMKKNGRGGLFQSGFSAPRWIKKILLAGFLGSFLIYCGITYIGSPSSPIESSVIQNPVQPGEEFLEGWRKEMGYTNLSRQDLMELRNKGVTATYTSRLRDLGYTDLSLDQVVRLNQNDVSSTFAAMMQELNYDLSPDKLIELRQHDVTAYFTSNMHDLGYTDITAEELIRLKDTGVEAAEANKFIEQQEGDQLPSVDELIRYHISNQ